MTSLKDRFSNAVESLFLVSILAWAVFAGAAVVSNPSAMHEPRGTVEIYALNDLGT